MIKMMTAFFVAVSTLYSITRVMKKYMISEFKYNAVQLKNPAYFYCEASFPTSSEYETLSETATLLNIYVMNRHGDRTPTYNLPNEGTTEWNCPCEERQITKANYIMYKSDFGNISQDRYSDINLLKGKFWIGNCTLGQLTDIGMDQLFRFGQRLKEIYIDHLGFINADWELSKNDIFIRSTDLWRTKQSVTSIYSGMFSEYKSKVLINIKTLSEKQDVLPPQDKACPKLVQIRNKLYKSREYKAFLHRFRKLRRVLESAVGSPRIGDDENLFDYFLNILGARKCHSKPLLCNEKHPSKCITEKNLVDLLKASDEEVRLMNRDGKIVKAYMAKLNAAPFLLNLKRNILLTLTNQPDFQDRKLIDLDHPLVSNTDLNGLKIFHYSAHDTSISSVIGALDASDMRWPPYASNIILELWKDTNAINSSKKNSTFNGYYLRMIYNGIPLETSWCVYHVNDSCTLDSFFQYLDRDLKLIAGFEVYSKFVIKAHKWDQVKECWG